MANALDQMDHILTHNVVNEHCTLFDLHMGMFESLKQHPVNVFLLFSAEEIGNAVRHEATVPRTSNCNDSGDITGLG
jgi:hypothetical protein